MDLYVDDSTSGTETASEGKKLYQKAKLIFSLADFDLRKWVTNCRELQAYFDENEKSFWLPSNLKKDDTNFTVS